MNYRIERALKTMKTLRYFKRDFHQFVRDESRGQADYILKQKDPPSVFDISSIDVFDYNKELFKLEGMVPILMASIAGTISASKAETSMLSRKVLAVAISLKTFH